MGGVQGWGKKEPQPWFHKVVKREASIDLGQIVVGDSEQGGADSPRIVEATPGALCTPAPMPGPAAIRDP